MLWIILGLALFLVGGFCGIAIMALAWASGDNREQLANAERPCDSESLLPGGAGILPASEGAGGTPAPRRATARVCLDPDCGAVSAAKRCPRCGGETLLVILPRDPFCPSGAGILPASDDDDYCEFAPEGDPRRCVSCQMGGCPKDQGRE